MGKKRDYVFVEEQRWSILNGNIKGDEVSEWTYTGGRGSVIDYVLGDERTRERVEELKVETRIDSDHYPITVEVKGEEKGRTRGKRKGREEEEESGQRKQKRNL